MSAENRQKDTFINFLYRHRFLLSALATINLHALAVLSGLNVVDFDSTLILLFAFPADGLVLFFMVRLIADRIKAT